MLKNSPMGMTPSDANLQSREILARGFRPHVYLASTLKAEYLHARLLEGSRPMKVTVEIEGKPSEVAALVGEIAGRRVSGNVEIESDKTSVDELVSMLEKARKA